MDTKTNILKKNYLRTAAILLIGFALFASLTIAAPKVNHNKGSNPAGIIPGTGGAAANEIVVPNGIAKKFGDSAGGSQVGFSAGASVQGHSQGASNSNSGHKGGGPSIGNNGYVLKNSGKEVFVGQPGSSVVVKINGKFSGFDRSFGKGNKELLGAGDSYSMAIEGLEELTWIAGAKGPNPGRGNDDVKARKDGDPGNPGGGNGNGHWGEGNQGTGKGNVASGNQGHGVGEGMTGGGHHCDNDTDNDIDADTDFDMDTDMDTDCDMDIDNDFDNDADSDTDVIIANTFEPVIRFPKAQGCPATIEAASNEIGIPEQTIQIRISDSLSSGANIQPCEVCQQIVNLAAILRDTDGSRLAALTEIVNSLAPADMPFTPEMGIQIAAAFQSNLEEDSRYASAAEYIDAFVEYAHILENRLPGVVEDPTAFVLEKYGSEITENDNPNIAAFVAMRLEALQG